MKSIRKIPKVELHEHLDGSVRPQTIIELAAEFSVQLPVANLQELKTLLSPGPSSLERYIQAFQIPAAVTQTAAALRRVAFEQVEDWYQDGVVYGEVRFAPEAHLEQGLSPQAVVEAVLLGLAEGRKHYPVETGLILCALRHWEPTVVAASLVNQYRNDGVVGFDLAGPEIGFRPCRFQKAFDYCAEHFLAATCHAGEVADDSYIREALVACRALRIGHGTQLLTGHSRDLISWVVDRRIPVEVCLRSNIQTKAAASIDKHPFKDFRQQGIAAVLCTDNRTVSSTTLSQELELAQTTWDLSITELRDLQATALRAAFCPQAVKQRLLSQHFPEST